MISIRRKKLEDSSAAVAFTPLAIETITKGHVFKILNNKFDSTNDIKIALFNENHKYYLLFSKCKV